MSELAVDQRQPPRGSITVGAGDVLWCPGEHHEPVEALRALECGSLRPAVAAVERLGCLGFVEDCEYRCGVQATNVVGDRVQQSPANSGALGLRVDEQPRHFEAVAEPAGHSVKVWVRWAGGDMADYTPVGDRDDLRNWRRVGCVQPVGVHGELARFIVEQVV